MKFCVKCGKGIDKGVFCKDCQPEEGDLRPLELTACACGRVYSEKRWIKRDLLTLVKEHAGRGATVSKAEIRIPEKGKATTPVQVRRKGKATTLNVTVLHGLCPMCHRQKSEYFEGVLQARSGRPSILSRLHKILQKLLAKKEERVFVAKVDEHKNGADLYFSDKRQMRRIALALHKEFGGSMSEHPTLFSHNHQSSRDLYRLTILLTLPDVEAGDVIDYKDGPVLVRRVAKRLTGRSMDDNRPVDLPSAGTYRVLPVRETVVSRIRPRLEAINPDTYQSEALHDVHHDLKEGQKVKIVVHARGLYLVKG